MKYLSLFALVAAASLRGQQLPSPPRLVADFSSEPATAISSEPSDFVAVGAMTCFVATTPTHGRELYRSFGSRNTTALVRDLAAGSASSFPTSLTAVASRLFFFANDGVHGLEVHVSDGTEEGTRMVADLEPGVAGSILRGGFAVNGKFVFARGDQSFGLEPWVSDGTAQGTHMLTDINVGSRSSFSTLDAIAAVVAQDAGGREHLVFVAAAASGLELWSSDGTPAGTVRLRSLGGLETRLVAWSAGRFRSGRGLLDLFVTSSAPTTQRQITIATDGSVQGTSVVADAAPRQFGTVGEKLRQFGSSLALPRGDSVLLVDVEPLASRSVSLPGGSTNPQVLHEVGSDLFVQVQRGSEVVLLRVSSGASSFVEVGTMPYPLSGAVNGADADTLVLGGKIVSTGVGRSSDMWAIDPASGQATLLAELVRGELVAGSGTAYFAIRDSSVGGEPGITDGSLGGTRVLIDLALPPSGQGTVSSRVSDYYAFGERALFAIARGTNELSVHVSDGTALGSVEIARVGARLLIDAVEAGGRMWFALRAPSGGSSLWVTDGSAAGTLQVRDPAAIEVLSNLLPIGDSVAFLGSSMNVTGLYLGAGRATVLLASMPGRISGRVARLGDRLVVASRDPLRTELALSVFDPVAQSLTNFANVPVQLAASFDLVTGHDRVWFAGLDAGGRDAIWSTDGTSTGTRIEFASSVASTLLVSGRVLIGRDSVWSALGQRILALDVRTRSGRVIELPMGAIRGGTAVLGNRLVYSSLSVGVSTELWSVEGSASAPERLRVMDAVTVLQSLGSRFAVVSGQAIGGGAELLVTDGTLAGTRVVGSSPLVLSNLSQFASARSVIGGQAWVSAADPALGVEPHVMDLGAAYEASVAACGGEGRAAGLDIDGA
ncbi:MAG: hypothetical protein AB7I19_20380, partial [Planctomycetota bacterium]